MDMPRKAVISKVAAENGISKVEAEKIIRSVLSSIAEELSDRYRFHIAEIGSVSVVKREPRPYFNPRSGNETMSEGKTALKINISKQMRARLDKANPE